MGSKAIEQIVAETAATTSKLKNPIPNGKCWAFVHHVLAAANAKSFYDFKKTVEDPVFAPWGDPSTNPGQGYIATFKNVIWRTDEVVTTGKGTIKTKKTIRKKHIYHKHVAVILFVKKNGALIVAQQGVPGDEAAPSIGTVPVKELDEGVVKYFKPVAMPAGKKTSSPTAAAKAAAGS